ncbi:unnamed protein product [Brachionus calyciflorus]|uniref:K Homology domain-containing protein n=1 Tax=Brachionus calyciflorus TaxID=104777 RepID=A0A813TQF4_9BILA|nr:unnamed protein product [Brachionus calyciflorus]
MANDIPNTAEYLAQLLKDKNQLAAFPNVFIHLERILDEEITRIRTNLFQLGAKEAVCLPEPVGPVLQITEKLYVPARDHPEFNFVGRILGPRGMTAKQLEQETGCKIMVRGKGSMRDKTKEEQMKGKPNWEHLNDELHVLITCEDTKNRADIKLKRAVEEIKKLLIPSAEGEDELKKKQLMELAIINGTYRDSSKLQQKMNPILIPGNNVLAAAVAANNGIRSPPNPLGQQLIISPRISSNPNNTPTQITDPTTGLIYTTIPTLYPDQATLNAAQHAALLEYHNGIDFTQAASLKAQRFSAVNGSTLRAHPYARVALS